ncbi:MAG TPA: twin-arginine translocase subunit TatC [Acidimicrobiales bacterium]|nr:twin-arginine translocase subunit TatC [Acidimicrobiales bacterium]
MTATADDRLEGGTPGDRPAGASGRSAPSPAGSEAGTMTLLEHLAELRRRVLISLLAVTVASVGAWFFYGQTLHFMTSAYRQYAQHHHQLTDKLIITSPLEGFTTRLKVTIYTGIALACPVIFWELWRFITPGLYRNEKRYIVPFVAAAVVLFSGGVATAVLVWPKALDWLINVSGSQVATLFSPSSYAGLYVTMCLVFGLVFMYPLVVVFLELSGVVPSATWRKWRRPAIVVLCLVAAVITPSSDPFSFLAMAVPMLVLYELSIVVGRLMHK